MPCAGQVLNTQLFGEDRRYTHHLATLLQHFPPISYGFAYGSGVFQQPELYQATSAKGSGPMLDFIFIVDDPVTWHTQVLIPFSY